jgi:hypothetical protein
VPLEPQRQLRDLTRAQVGLSAERTRELPRHALNVGPSPTSPSPVVSVPGIGEHGAENLLTEIGTDMGVLHSAEALASWVGGAPAHASRQGRSTRSSEQLSRQAAERASNEQPRVKQRAGGQPSSVRPQ